MSNTEFTPANALERVMLAVSQGEDERPLLTALYDAELVLPQPFGNAQGPSTQWQIAVFDEVCPVYSSPEQLAKAIPDGMHYAIVPMPTLMKYWDERRPMALNLGGDLSVQIPGGVIKTLPDGLGERAQRVPVEADLGLAPATSPDPATLAHFAAFGERHPEVASAHALTMAPPPDRVERLLVVLMLQPGSSRATVAQALGQELGNAIGADISAVPVSPDEPDEIGAFAARNAPPFWRGA